MYGDGLSASLWNGTDGNWTLEDLNGNVISQGQADFGFNTSKSFFVSQSTPSFILEKISSKLKIIVYPNPFSKTVRIRLKKDIKGVIPIQILDQTGKLVLENMIDADLSPEIILQTETMAPGLYYLMFEINGRKYPVQLSKI